jgi:acrylyl-CoA reductase (NADPH)
MSDGSFRALVARNDGAQTVAIEQWTEAQLPEAAVTAAVDYSSFNYKDGLALTGRGRILRKYPIVPGVDWAGTVTHSASPRFQPGDQVILTGWGVGENWSGGFAERARAKPEWLVKLPDGMSPFSAMALGTAGFTAMLAATALQRHGVPAGGEVLVTGAAGGVGSIAVRLLSRMGYRVTAMTGRVSETPFLQGLGAAAVMDRAAYAERGKPLAGERWQGAVDTVGGNTLANVLAATAWGGAVAACGLAGGSDLPATVFPFILRNVALLGIDSVACPLPQREEAWRALAAALQEDELKAMTQTVNLPNLPALAEVILAGHVRGRTVVDLRA